MPGANIMILNPDVILAEVISLIAGSSSDEETVDCLHKNVTDSALEKGATSQGSICFLLARDEEEEACPACVRSSSGEVLIQFHKLA